MCDVQELRFAYTQSARSTKLPPMPNVTTSVIREQIVRMIRKSSNMRIQAETKQAPKIMQHDSRLHTMPNIEILTQVEYFSKVARVIDFRLK
jgi:hypothetical protein